MVPRFVLLSRGGAFGGKPRKISQAVDASVVKALLPGVFFIVRIQMAFILSNSLKKNHN